ncbi:DM13 domain-containing protein [Pseudonocardia abyssalis]|uniref:DM13 domain-containing protein n=1 Tax=Pseudonocardia abyssalis TaxID=2792008 RepID=A0ABS6UV36_9PSEU|nr:DM13 domain-containing protein [Pseudonocardia abyssalis]MBW0116787.1 DM13 domain-containing protein [Pseudonocardia abyssalis]MBW0135599.1 DM13 domain-containing protein [Pseudonocardia abyssalis]
MALLRRPTVLIGLCVVAVLVVVAVSVFQPWKLFVDRTVDEAVPTVAAPVAVAAPADPAGPVASAGPAAPSVAPAVEPVASGPVELARGELISHEHASSGSVVVLELPDGSRVLRLEDLDTSDGPLLKVWLTDAPVLEGRAGWHVFDDGAYEDLGELKGNRGSSNYAVPAEADLGDLTSVSIWCDRFDVSFAAAELVPAT